MEFLSKCIPASLCCQLPSALGLQKLLSRLLFAVSPLTQSVITNHKSTIQRLASCPNAELHTSWDWIETSEPSRLNFTRRSSCQHNDPEEKTEEEEKDSGTNHLKMYLVNKAAH